MSEDNNDLMAQRIKELRIKRGLSQEQLAELLGLQKSAIAKYENGRVINIKRSTIANMAEIFNCNPSYIMGWSDSEYENNPVMKIMLNSSEDDPLATEYLKQEIVKHKTLESGLSGNTTELNSRDKKDIAKDLDNIMHKLQSGEDGPATFDGQELSPESAELFKIQLESMLTQLKVINKEKYNPNKNKK